MTAAGYLLLRLFAYLGLLLALPLAVASCGSQGVPGKLAEGQALPELTLVGLEGGALETKSLQGKLLVLNVWATWCPPCRKEMPSLERLSKAVDPGRMVVIGLTVDKDANLAREFLRQYGITFPNYIDSDMKTANDILRVVGFPETFLVGPDGKLVKRIVGEREWDSPQMKQTLEDAYRGRR